MNDLDAGEKTVDDAPVHLDANEASAWASGYNAALHDLQQAQTTESESEPLSVRLTRDKEQVAALQREVQNLPHFLGQFHAENGLRQAVSGMSTCLGWLPTDTDQPCPVCRGISVHKMSCRPQNRTDAALYGTSSTGA